MPCLDDVQVLDYLERRVPEAGIAAIRQHLDGCSDCLSLVSQLSQTSARVAADGLSLGKTIASGGMGLIVEGWDAKLERRIALKIPRHDDPHAQRRFAREVKITARLQHPAIVPVYAAGTLDDGEPYYAMRLVEGASLDAAIDAAATTRDRLALVRVVVQVAGAIAYAHSQGIVHRDIKPANVLVGPFGEVVVIDWGLARSLRDASDDGALATGSPGPISETVDGAIVGTPAYMAPEQARGEPVDERADVYALGALLYHVLRGKPPGAPADLVTIEDLPVDLVAIVTRAMASDPAVRYPSAQELAADLERFTTGRLVDAHAYSVWQLATRFIRRHRAAVTVGALLVVALGITAIVANRKIGSAEHTATTQRAATEDLVDYMLADLQTKLAKIGKLDLLAGVGEKIEGYYVALGDSPAQLSAVDLGRWSRALDVLGDVAVQAGDLARAKAHYERALAYRRQLAATGAPRADVLAALGTSHGKLGKIQRETGDAAAALASYQASRDAFAELGDTRRQADAMIQIGWAQLDRKNPSEVRAAFEAGLALAEQLPRDAGGLRVELNALFGLGMIEEQEGKLDQALARARRGVTTAEALAKADDTPANRQVVATAVQRVGAVAEKSGDRAGALAAFQRSAELLAQLTVHDPTNAAWKRDHAEAMSRVGDAERALGHAKETIAAYEQSRAIREALVAQDPKNLVWLRELAMSYGPLAQIDFDLGALDQAEQKYRAGLAIVEKLVAAERANQLYRHDLYATYGELGHLTHARGDLDGALAWFERRLATARGMVDAQPSNAHRFALSNAHEDMSTILMDRGDAPGARDHAEKSLALRERLVAESPDHAAWRSALANSLSTLAQAQDAPATARTLIAKSLGHRRTIVAADPADTIARVDLLLDLMIEARITRDLKDYGAAATSQTEARTIAEALAAADPKSGLFALYVEQVNEIGGDISADQQQLAEAARQYQAAIAALAPFVDAELSDSHFASEVAEARWKLSRVVTGPERAMLVRDALAVLERLRRTKRLSPQRMKLFEQVKRG